MTLDSIQNAKRIRPPRILLIGTEKVGKSTFASSAPSPIVVSVKGEEGVDDFDVPSFPLAESFIDVRQALMTLQQTKDYKTLVIDSASALHPLVIKASLEKESVDSEPKLGGGYGHQYDTPLIFWSEIMQAIDRLRAHGMASILIGHVQTKTFQDPINGSYTRYSLDLPEKIAQAIYRWVDVILFADWNVYTQEKDLGFNRTQTIGVGSGDRRLYTQKRPSHPGGGRGVYGHLPYELPLEWKAFQNEVSKLVSSPKKEKVK